MPPVAGWMLQASKALKNTPKWQLRRLFLLTWKAPVDDFFHGQICEGNHSNRPDNNFQRTAVLKQVPKVWQQTHFWAGYIELECWIRRKVHHEVGTNDQ